MSGHLRRSSVVMIGPIAAILMGSVIVGDVNRWRFEWDWGMLVPGSALIVVGPLLAAGGALDAVRARLLMADLARGEEAARRSVWPPFVILAVVSLGLWLVALLPVSVVLATSRATGSIRWLPLLAQGIAFPGFVAVGALLGLRIPRWWVPPLLGVSVYVIPILWRDEAFAVHPVVVATYLSGIGTPLAHSFIVLIISLALVLVLAPASTVPTDVRVRYRLAIRSLLALAVVLGLAGDLAPAVAAEDPTVCRRLSRSSVCTSGLYAGSIDHIGEAFTSTVRRIEALGVELPPIVVVSERATAEHVGAGLIVGAHPGLVRAEWTPDPRYADDDLPSRLRRAIATGSCESWWSDTSPPEWAPSTAAEVLDVYLLEGSLSSLELSPGIRKHLEGEGIPGLLDAVFTCDTLEIEAVLLDAGFVAP